MVDNEVIEINAMERCVEPNRMIDKLNVLMENAAWHSLERRVRGRAPALENRKLWRVTNNKKANSSLDS